MPAIDAAISRAYSEPLPHDAENLDTRLVDTPGESIEDSVAEQLPDGADPRAGRAKRRRSLLRRPGLTATDNELDKTMEIIEYQVRKERDEADEQTIFEITQARFAELVEEGHPKFLDEFVRLMQISWNPNRRFLRENVELAACREVAELRHIEEILTGCPFGRPSGRELPLAVLLRATLGCGRADLKSNYDDLTGSNLELDWALFGTPDMEANREKVRDLSVVRKTLKAMLDRNDPAIILDANLALLKRIAERHADEDGFTEVGRYLIIDGTDITAHVEQLIAVSEAHRKLIAKATGARRGYHGSKGRTRKMWIGWTLIVIIDMITGLPLIWALVEADGGRERRRVRRGTPGVRPGAPVRHPPGLPAARAAQRQVAARRHQRRAALLQARRDEAHPGRGVRVPSKDTAVPYSQPIRYEADYARAAKGWRARIRWRCEGCKADGVRLTTTTRPAENPRIYTYLDRGGDHISYATRLALMRRRNAIEATFNILKHRDIGEKKHHKVRWATRQRHMEWAIGLALFGMSVRREVHETDLYEQKAEEVWNLGLVKAKPPVVPRKRPLSKPLTDPESVDLAA